MVLREQVEASTRLLLSKPVWLGALGFLGRDSAPALAQLQPTFPVWLQSQLQRATWVSRQSMGSSEDHDDRLQQGAAQ